MTVVSYLGSRGGGAILISDGSDVGDLSFAPRARDRTYSKSYSFKKVCPGGLSVASNSSHHRVDAGKASVLSLQDLVPSLGVDLFASSENTQLVRWRSVPGSVSGSSGRLVDSFGVSWDSFAYPLLCLLPEIL